jgi:hypothetical protein
MLLKKFGEMKQQKIKKIIAIFLQKNVK